MANLDDLRRITEVEFAAIVKDCISIHRDSQGEAENSPFPQNPIAGFRSFMEFVHEKLRTSPTP